MTPTFARQIPAFAFFQNFLLLTTRPVLGGQKLKDEMEKVDLLTKAIDTEAPTQVG